MRTIIFLVGSFVVSALARSQADEACGKASRRGVLTGAPAPDGQEVGRVMRTFRTASRTAAALVTMAALGGVQLASAPPAAAFLEFERAEGISGLPSWTRPRARRRPVRLGRWWSAAEARSRAAAKTRPPSRVESTSGGRRRHARRSARLLKGLQSCGSHVRWLARTHTGS